MSNTQFADSKIDRSMLTRELNTDPVTEDSSPREIADKLHEARVKEAHSLERDTKENDAFSFVEKDAREKVKKEKEALDRALKQTEARAADDGITKDSSKDYNAIAGKDVSPRAAAHAAVKDAVEKHTEESEKRAEHAPSMTSHAAPAEASEIRGMGPIAMIRDAMRSSHVRDDWEGMKNVARDMTTTEEAVERDGESAGARRSTSVERRQRDASAERRGERVRATDAERRAELDARRARDASAERRGERVERAASVERREGAARRAEAAKDDAKAESGGALKAALAGVRNFFLGDKDAARDDMADASAHARAARDDASASISEARDARRVEAGDADARGGTFTPMDRVFTPTGAPLDLRAADSTDANVTATHTTSGGMVSPGGHMDQFTDLSDLSDPLAQAGALLERGTQSYVNSRQTASATMA